MKTYLDIFKYLLKSFVFMRDIFGYLLPGTVFAMLMDPAQSRTFLASNPSWLLLLAVLTLCYAAGNILFAFGIWTSEIPGRVAKRIGHRASPPRDDEPADASGPALPLSVLLAELFHEHDWKEAETAAKNAGVAKGSRTDESRAKEWYMQGMLYPSLYPDIFVEPQRHENVQIMRVGLSMAMIAAAVANIFLRHGTNPPNLLYMWIGCALVGAWYLYNSQYGPAGIKYRTSLYLGAMDASRVRLSIDMLSESTDTRAPERAPVEKGAAGSRPKRP